MVNVDDINDVLVLENVNNLMMIVEDVLDVDNVGMFVFVLVNWIDQDGIDGIIG